MTNRTVGIAGGGLVGSLLAGKLAKSGLNVDLFEKRPDMRKSSVGGGRSINLAISVRGLHAVDSLGIKEKVLSRAIAMKGRMMHSLDGNLIFQAYGIKDSEVIHSISRSELNQLLLEQAEIEGAKVFFDTELEGLNSFPRTYDWVVGADGSGSKIREFMQKSGAVDSRIDFLEHGYKELTIPADREGHFQIEKHALHIWPRGQFMLIALPNLDGSFTCTLFLPFKGEKSFESLNSPEKVLDFFEEHFTDACPLLANLEEEFFQNPTSLLGTVRTKPWTDGQFTCLIGDAAHGIVPFFGQGMNCGFEDVMEFCELGQSADWEPQKFFDYFSENRRPQADAIADMAIENFIEMRDRVGDPKFILRKKVENWLQEKLPQFYKSRYSMVSFSRIPYKVAQEVGVKESKVLDDIIQGISTPDEIDLKGAEALLRKEITPLISPWIES